jgi:ribosomal protein S18 acetylase RimI-like enzyme
VNEPHLAEDQWLAARLGRPAFHLLGALDAPGRWSEDVAHRLKRQPVFIDLKVPVEDRASVERAAKLGFTLIDTNLRLSTERTAIPAVEQNEVAFAKPDMEAAVGAIAERAFVFDRFHRDPRTAQNAGIIKRDWARNFFSGRRGEWMVVASRSGAPVGFLQLLRSAAGELVIDLIAVDPARFGQGLASAMIGFAAQHCDVPGPVVVGTQLANVRSIRLYERLGFRLRSAQYVFHHHGGQA